jgi:hypothetical protein
LPPVATKVEE